MGLPSGRPAREAFKGRGVQGGYGRGSDKWTIKKGWLPFLVGWQFGEASACYLIRCETEGKVATAAGRNRNFSRSDPRLPARPGCLWPVALPAQIETQVLLSFALFGSRDAEGVGRRAR
jgi:hypothetical protein